MSDNQLVALLENLLLTPSSDFYISTILHNPNGTAADPLHAKSVDLGTIGEKDLGLKVGIVLKDLVVKGLSNAQVKFDGRTPEITVDGNLVTFHAKVPNNQPGYTRPADVPDRIEMSGGLDVTIEGQAMPPGTIQITVNSVADVKSTFEATLEKPNDLKTANIDIKSIEIAPGTQQGNIVFKLDLNTGFLESINDILNQSDTQDASVSEVNKQMNQPAELAPLSKAAT